MRLIASHARICALFAFSMMIVGSHFLAGCVTRSKATFEHKVEVGEFIITGFGLRGDVKYPLYVNGSRLVAEIRANEMSSIDDVTFSLEDAYVNIFDNEGDIAFRITVPRGKLQHVHRPQ
jgi:hypothetical protein